MVFLNRTYARAQPSYANAPRAFFLALTCIAPPHALLSLTGAVDGAAAPSIPMREYFHSSGVDGVPHVRDYLLLFIHLCQCRPAPCTHGLLHRQGGEYAHPERFLGGGARQLLREQPRHCSIWPRRGQMTLGDT